MDDAEIVQENDVDTSPYGDFDEDELGARIKVFGVGGGGGNAIQYMIDSGLQGVHFIVANTDRQALMRNSAETRLQLGEKLTRGRGAGADPKVGREAANESINAIRDAIGDAELVFVTAGMGGGTGTGGAAVVAQAAKELNVLTVGVVTKPFSFEGARRKKLAESGLEELKKYVDCLITIPNDRLICLAPKKASFKDMLERSNEVLYHAVKGISDIVNGSGMINVDFADVRTTMGESGLALMGTGVGQGENRARDAAQKAITSPLLEDVSLNTAKAILYNVTAGGDITTEEMDEIGKLIQEEAPEDCNIIFGLVYDDNMGDEISVTLIATGIEAQEAIELPEEEFTAPQKNVVKRFPRETPQETQRESMSGPVRRHPFSDFEGEKRSQPKTGRSELETIYRGRTAYQHPTSLHRPGAVDFSYDEVDTDVPTFIRRQAD